MSHLAYQIIEKARSELKQWAADSGLPIHRLDFVAVFEDWSDSHHLWVFYPTNKDLVKFNKDGTSEKIGTKYLELLELHDFPFSEFPKVGFKFDSDENVQENFSGNYFHRLR